MPKVPGRRCPGLWLLPWSGVTGRARTRGWRKNPLGDFLQGETSPTKPVVKKSFVAFQRSISRFRDPHCGEGVDRKEGLFLGDFTVEVVADNGERLGYDQEE
jgi:hypothetical protein